ncbi:MAG TPA: sodium:solute symporter [Candidatus Marinimicrobia bacterium]|nr:sodium:solute symporter [Candidatus Neomarinimicrobiota bacterium]
MNIIDTLIIIFFLVSLVVYGLYQGKKNQTTKDFFLGGKNLPWVVAMFSIVATETSVLTFISIPGKAYRGEWFFLQLALGYILGRILVSIFLLPQYFRNEVTSIYQVLGSRFGPNIQKTASIVFLITRVLADGVRFLATAVIVQVITGWSLLAAVIVIGVVTGIYTLSGGIRTIMWIDSLQFILYLGAGLISVGFIIFQFHEPAFSILKDIFDKGKFQIIQLGWDIQKPYMFVNSLIGGMLLSFASHGADHMMVQRVLSTRNLSAARKAMIGSGIFVFFQFVIFLFVGSLLYALFQNVDLTQVDIAFLNDDKLALKKDREFPLFIVQYLPVGLKGLLLAGVLSAAMSTLSSSINSLASSTIIDWSWKGRSLRGARFISLFWTIVLISIALIFDESDKAIVDMGLEIASFTYGGLLGMFILSRSKRPFHSLSLILGLVFSIVIVILLREFGIAWTWFISFSVITNIAVTYSVDLIFFRHNA